VVIAFVVSFFLTVLYTIPFTLYCLLLLTLNVRPTAVRAISTYIICQTIVQHCRTSDLELTAICCVKLRLSLSAFKSRLKTRLFSTAFC